MFKKLCVLFVGLGLCFGALGCGSGKVEEPKDQTPPKAETPGDAVTPADPG